MNKRPAPYRPGLYLESFLDERECILQALAVVSVNLTECFAPGYTITNLFLQIQAYRGVDCILHLVSSGSQRVRCQTKELSITSRHKTS